MWKTASDTLGVHPIILQEVYIDNWCTGIGADDFRRIVAKTSDRRHDEWRSQIKAQCDAKAKTLNGDALAEQERRIQEIWADADFIDIMMHRLKCIIEIGDEILADEDKTFLGGTQYITAGKRYAITTLESKSETGPEFRFTTTTDLPDERNWGCELACKSVWRNGVEIWNWHKAYLELWMEQNQNHPQTQEMIDYCNKAIE